MRGVGKVLKVFILTFSLTFAAYGQDLPPDDDEVPVDGGISALIALGVFWGVKKIKNKGE